MASSVARGSVQRGFAMPAAARKHRGGGDDDDADFRVQALPVTSAPISLDGPPTSADEYLRRVKYVQALASATDWPARAAVC